MLQPPPRPQKGEPIPHDWFLNFYDYVKSLQLRGDMKTTQVSRDRSGTVVRAPMKHLEGRGGGGGNRSVMVARITTDNNDGTYDGNAEYNDNKSWGARTTGTYTFDSGNNGNLHEINGRAGVPIDTRVIVHQVEDADGGIIWYFDATTDQYGFEASATNEHGGDGTVGAWVEITGGSGSSYNWKMKDPDASTDASPAVTGTGTLQEVNGREGIPSGSIAWAWYDGTNYQFEHHGADAGTAKNRKRTQADGATPDSDDWERKLQGSDRGVDVNFLTGLFADATNNKLYSFYRTAKIDANGHLDELGAENIELVGCVTFTCGGSGTPPATTDIHWPYEEGSGSTVADIGGSGHDGTGTSLSWATGQIGSYCGDFDGSSSYVSVPNTSDLDPGSGDFTVALWANFDTNNFAYLISRSGGNTDSHVSWNIQYSSTDSKIYGQCQVSGTDNRVEYSTSTPSTLGWIHICMKRDGSNIYLYIDGTQEDSSAISGSINSNGVALVMGGTYRINSSSFEASFDGKLDDVRYYSRALSDAEISALATP